MTSAQGHGCPDISREFQISRLAPLAERLWQHRHSPIPIRRRMQGSAFDTRTAMHFRHCLLSATVGLAILLFSSLGHARDYLIEVVLFETVAGQNLSSGGLYYPRMQNSLRLGTEDAVAEGFLPVEQNLTLSENAASIAASSRYRLLRHLSWRQPGLAADDAKAVRVALGNTIDMYIPADRRQYTDFYPATANPTPNNTESISTFTLNGTISVRLGRFLHMDTRLVFTDDQTGQSFRLLQTRKMRSRELHYIDNPRFGLLTQITPLEDKVGTASGTEDEADEALAAPE